MEEKNTESAGQEFVRWLRPGGCILLIVIAVLVIAMCFISGQDPIPGYAPPQSSEYYAEHLDELKTELETNVFPIIGGVLDCSVQGDKLNVTLEASGFAVTRSAILRYYDIALFEFVSNTE